ncbi:MAG: sulfatase [Planctomycetaceae bacterium]|nr:sulfatase [Planctomycetaceae bacterium]
MLASIRTLRLVAAVAITAILSAPAPLARAAAGDQPNIVILLADDMGFADVGFQGCPDIPTPHVDRLAAGGVRCTNGYISGPYCSPTRAGLLTGRYQQRFGHEFNPGGGEGGKASGAAGLPVSETTLADRLKAAGYATGLVGKWHLGGAPQFHPQRRGFNEFFGFLGGAHSYFPGDGAPILRSQEVVREPEYLTDAFAREAVSFIDRHQEKPFFLYLAFNAVHTPMHATDKRLERFASISDPMRRTYAAMLVAMDEAIGQVLDKLKNAGLEENTLVFFFSDNGGPVMQGTTINGSINKPLRGSKRTTLEGGIRTPFVVRWPARLAAGKTYDQPVIQLDVQPTALAAAGVAIDPSWKLDGVNLLPHLLGENTTPPHDALYWRLGRQMAIRQGDWKLVRYDAAADDMPRQPVVGPRLYNLKDDIGEQHDLAARLPDKAKELEAAWDAWSAEMVQPLWGDGRAEGARRRANPRANP